jgi:hypothetical protein
VLVLVRVHMARCVQDISGERLGGVVVSQYGTGGYWKRREEGTVEHEWKEPDGSHTLASTEWK